MLELTFIEILGMQRLGRDPVANHDGVAGLILGDFHRGAVDEVVADLVNRGVEGAGSAPLRRAEAALEPVKGLLEVFDLVVLGELVEALEVLHVFEVKHLASALGALNRRLRMRLAENGYGLGHLLLEGG